MEMLWSNHLSVGNAIIDSEHRKLISFANDAIRAIETRDSSYMDMAFKQLEWTLSAHFESEVKIARAAGLDMSKLQLTHKHVLKELQLLRYELVGTNGLWSENAVDHHSHFLKNLLIDDHIIKLDMQMSPALQTLGYQFRPDDEGC